MLKCGLVWLEFYSLNIIYLLYVNMLDINIFLCLCNVVQHIYFQIILPFFYKILFENFHSFDASVLYDNVKTPQDHNID